MLNRRYLRIKAMQNVFAYLQCRQSDYHLALDLIREEFAPDLNSMEVQDPVKLEENRKAAAELFVKSYEERKLQNPDAYTPEQASAAQDALTYYNKLVQQDFDHLRKTMVTEAEKLAGFVENIKTGVVHFFGFLVRTLTLIVAFVLGRHIDHTA